MAGFGSLGGLGGFLNSPNGSSVLQALGTSLLSSPRQAPLQSFGQNLNAFTQQNREMADQQADRDGLKQFLVAQGLSPEEAEMSARNPQLAKLQLDTLQQRKEASANQAFMGQLGGLDDTSPEADPMPTRTAPAPGGPDLVALGVEAPTFNGMSGDTQGAPRTEMADAGAMQPSSQSSTVDALLAKRRKIVSMLGSAPSERSIATAKAYVDQIDTEIEIATRKQPQEKPDEYAGRERAAAQYGLEPGSPAYQAFVLTGKMPREDQAPLTATDKKAIIEADDMVAANENAIAALDQASTISDKANSGWFAGTRASLGNNLPDLMVPDFVSSPDSSIATTDMDNAVVGQALASLKTIFGGNPTEGERAILLELQGSSSQPKEVRNRIFERAKTMAERRLVFNRDRAAGLRGGDYYKTQGAPAAPPPPASDASPPPSGTATSGIKWSVEP